MQNNSIELARYVRQLLNKGKSEEEIRQKLTEKDWKPELIDDAIASARQMNDSQTSEKEPTQADTQPAPPPQTQPAAPPQASSQSYRLFQALGDVTAAIQHNTGAFIGSIVVSWAIIIVLSFIFTLTLAAVPVELYQEPSTASSTAGQITTAMSVLSFFVTLTLLFGAVIGAVLTTVVALGLHSGMKKQKFTLKLIITSSFARIIRVSLANLLLSITVMAPFLLSLLLLSVIESNRTAPTVGINLDIIAYALPMALAGIAWAVYCFFRYSLAPYVAMFEPETPILKTLGRSRRLLSKGGTLFLLKGLLLLLAIFLVAGTITTPIASSSNSDAVLGIHDIITLLISVPISVYASGALFALYHKRSTQS